MSSPAPVAIELSPAPSPWAVAQRLAFLPHLAFFDSAGGPESLTRFSYVTADPTDWLTSHASDVRWNGLPAHCDPFTLLAQELDARRRPALPDLPPFQGGAAGLFGYDLCHWLERLPRALVAEFDVPDMAVGYYDWVAAWDHRRDRAWLIGPPSRLAEVQRSLRDAHAAHSPPVERMEPAAAYRHPLPGHDGVYSNFRRDEYEAAVDRAIEYIHAGDCFQVNVAQRLLARATVPPLTQYGRLRMVNAAPFAGYFDLGNYQILSASPERFLSVTSGGRMVTRPIKGTRPRGATSADDERICRELVASAKDRAENVMIVDLLRNDLGRVAEYGSVEVSGVCKLESYATVHHLVSEVQARLRPGATAVDLLRSAFPGGSVTGAPKIRAMEIIAELEPTQRGPYCGCLGWLGFDGSMDTSILIRTITQGRGWLQFPVGGGIVADSNTAREYDETLHKATGMLRALEARPQRVSYQGP